MTNKWKIDDNGGIVMKDGNPVYIDNNGEERTMEADTVTKVNRDAMTHRVAREGLEAKLKQFEGLDATEAREALSKLAAMTADGNSTNDKIEELKASLSKQYETTLSEKDNSYNDLKKKHETLLIDNAFNGSEYIKNNIAVPLDMYRATFRDQFKVEDGKLVVYDVNGKQFWSKDNPGEYASVEESLKLLTESHPSKERILKANVASGSSSNGSGSGGSGYGGKYMSRQDFQSLPGAKQAELATKLQTGELQLTD